MIDEVLYFCLCSYGLTQILVYGSVFKKVRPSHHFFQCPMCVGFWVGVFLWAFSPYSSLFMFGRGAFTGFLLGCLSSGVSYFLIQTVGDGGIRYEKVDVTTSQEMS